MICLPNRKVTVSAALTALALSFFSPQFLFDGPHSSAASGPSPNVGVAQMDEPERFSSIYALSDVHGMYRALIPLLRSARLIDQSGHWIGGRSLLVIVGDSIDKGPASIEVIDFWMRLSADATSKGGTILHLLGNHEAEFLADPYHDPKAAELIAELQARGLTIDDMVSPLKPRGQFLRSMPFAARIGRWLFVHAGYVSSPSFQQFVQSATLILQSQNYNDPFLIGDDSALEAKAWWQTTNPQRSLFERWLTDNGFNGVVFGHMPEALNVVGATASSGDGHLIKIDNGMAPEAGSHSGSVLVFPNPAELENVTRVTVRTIVSGNAALQPVRTEKPEKSLR